MSLVNAILIVLTIGASLMFVLVYVNAVRGWRKTLDGWGETLDGFQPTAEYVWRLEDVVNEAISHISEDDPEAALALLNKWSVASEQWHASISERAIKASSPVVPK